MTPVFSIITPSYNQGQYLEETIQSILQQKDVTFEYILIDGGSTDDSLSIIKKYANHFSYWISEKDRGQSHAINKGLMQAKGELILWINSDDILLPSALKQIQEEFKKDPNTIMIHGKSILFGKGKKDNIIGKDPGDLFFRYPGYIPFPQPSSAFRRILIEKTGPLDESLHYGMDHELLVRAFLNGKIKYIDKVLSKYRLHPEAKTNSPIQFAQEWNETFSRFINSISNAKEIKADLLNQGWHSGTDKFYPTELNIPEKDLKKIVFYHLLIQFHYYYKANELHRLSTLNDLLLKYSPKLYQENKIGKYYRRSRLIPPALLSLLRKLKG